jgi:hypothetical protein
MGAETLAAGLGACKRRSSTKQSTKQSKGPVLQEGGGPAPQEERRTATVPGYVDVWARLVLRGKQFLPLARQLFSSRHPAMPSRLPRWPPSWKGPTSMATARFGLHRTRRRVPWCSANRDATCSVQTAPGGLPWRDGRGAYDTLSPTSIAAGDP